jgi:predicted enzyme involved in methoxymalonyl-ACP biosynthesis
MMDELVRICKERGIAEIRGYYYPTAKNGMVRDFYQVQGFEQMNDVSGTEPGDTVWSLKLSDSPVCRNKYITVDRGGSL